MSLLRSVLGVGRTLSRDLSSGQDNESMQIGGHEELVDQLLKERQRASEKEEEIARMRVQMAKLEEMLDQQAEINQLDEEHLTKLEAALAKLQDEKNAVKGQEVQNLETALAEAKESAEVKEEELIGMRVLVAKLEETIEQQDKVAEMNKEQQGVIVDLMGALNEEKQKAEQVSKTQESSIAQLQEQLASLQVQLKEASQRQLDAEKASEADPEKLDLKSRLEDAQQRMEELEKETKDKAHKLAQVEVELQRAQEESALGLVTSACMTSAASCKRQVSVRSNATDSSEQLAVLGQQLEDMETKQKELMREVKQREAHSAGLQAQLACEESKRKAAERVIDAAENELKFLKEQLAVPSNQSSRRRQKSGMAKAEDMMKVQEQLRQELVLRQQQDESIAAKEAEVMEMRRKLTDEEEERAVLKQQASKMQEEVTELQSRLAEELAERQQVQTKYIEKERKVCELQAKVPQEVTAMRAQQARILQKDVQICELQQELADELCMRQTVQSQALDLEDQLFMLKQQLAAEQNKRAEAETKMADKDEQLQLMRKQFAKELLTSFEKSDDADTVDSSGLQFHDAVSSEGGQVAHTEGSASTDSLPCSGSAYTRTVPLKSRQISAPPDTGSSDDQRLSYMPEAVMREVPSGPLGSPGSATRESFGASTGGPLYARVNVLPSREFNAGVEATVVRHLNLEVNNGSYGSYAPVRTASKRAESQSLTASPGLSSGKARLIPASHVTVLPPAMPFEKGTKQSTLNVQPGSSLNIPPANPVNIPKDLEGARPRHISPPASQGRIIRAPTANRHMNL